ncbi:hypothetical protein C41B8_07642 [Salinisphaera hydrothermalis C41B8]|uniref:Uncharacterized protein n=1 Tax=Salinisphaera hydrothermalis (strain C41B8) TaxID=1304275 RepID=A0A084IMG8_SALHC|nr:hypothetical protein C41B8_07642 [Salinisphaera hydrothermalis C41B8]
MPRQAVHQDRVVNVEPEANDVKRPALPGHRYLGARDQVDIVRRGGAARFGNSGDRVVIGQGQALHTS